MNINSELRWGRGNAYSTARKPSHKCAFRLKMTTHPLKISRNWQSMRFCDLYCKDDECFHFIAPNSMSNGHLLIETMSEKFWTLTIINRDYVWKVLNVDHITLVVERLLRWNHNWAFCHVMKFVFQVMMKCRFRWRLQCLLCFSFCCQLLP